MSTITKKNRIDQHTAALINKFEIALYRLEQAKPFAKSLYQTEVFQLAIELTRTDEGLYALYQNAQQFDKAGVFYGGLWEDAAKMEPSFVGGSLRLREGVNSILELLSEMRMLAIAKGNYVHPDLSMGEAGAFLNEVLALNLDLLFPLELAEGDPELEDHIVRAHRLFRYLGQELSFKAIAEKIVQEINRLTVQRPIKTERILHMIDMSGQLVASGIDGNTADELLKYTRAAKAPTPLSKDAANQREYRLKLEHAFDDELEAEAKIFAGAMKDTGIVSPYHVVLLRFLNRKNSHIIPISLDLSETGIACFHAHKKLIHDIIQVSIYPETRQALYGLALMLDRGILIQESLPYSLNSLFDLPLHAKVRQALSRPETEHGVISMNGLLIAGVISVLGQPLGVGQGHNPTCQSARAISLWSQHGIDRLMDYITCAARDHSISMTFEGDVIHSSLLIDGMAHEMDEELDPVSTILVPHLDKIYLEMMKRTLLRGEDGHKWVNPEFYGEWVPRGFLNAIDQMTLHVSNYPAFIKLFYATHHPDYNEGFKLVYPNPVGIFITNVHGELLGLHAVSIQRITKDKNGEYRIYFYNPNNDSGQNWGQGIKISVSGFGELEGESSLPFQEFVSRMYAFHYNPFEQGDTYMVEDSLVQEVQALAKDSWGKNYQWVG